MIQYFNPTVIMEWVAFFAALFLLNNKTGYWRLFIPWLFLGICAETTGWYLYTQIGVRDNALPFNLFLLVSIPFLLLVLSGALEKGIGRKIIRIATIVFIAFGLLNVFAMQGPWHYNSHTEAVGDIMLALCCCYLLIYLVKQEELDLLKAEFFWLAIGTLIYALGSAMVYQFSYHLMDYYKVHKVPIGNYINYGLNFIFYATLIVAFICRRITTRS